MRAVKAHRSLPGFPRPLPCSTIQPTASRKLWESPVYSSKLKRRENRHTQRLWIVTARLAIVFIPRYSLHAEKSLLVHYAFQEGSGRVLRDSSGGRARRRNYWFRISRHKSRQWAGSRLFRRDDCRGQSLQHGAFRQADRRPLCGQGFRLPSRPSADNAGTASQTGESRGGAETDSQAGTGGTAYGAQKWRILPPS